MIYVGLFFLTLLILGMALGLYLLINPVILRINSLETLYRIDFSGGNAYYDRRDGDMGVAYKLLHISGFKPFREFFEKKPGKKIEEELEKKIEDVEKEREKVEKKEGMGFFEIIELIKTEKEILKKVLNELYAFLKDAIRLVEIKYLKGTFCLDDPYWNGVIYGVLAPQCNPRVCICTNFIEENYLTGEIIIVPGKVLWRTLVLVVSIPWIRIYKIHKRLSLENKARAKACKTTEREDSTCQTLDKT